MKRVIVPVLLLGLLAVFAKWSIAADSDADEAKAIAAVEKLGGKVLLDDESPNKPVIAIDLGKTKIADADLDLVKAFSQLETLNLDHTEIGDFGLERVKELTRLQVLGLWETKVTDAGLAHLEGLTKSFSSLRRASLRTSSLGITLPLSS